MAHALLVAFQVSGQDGTGAGIEQIMATLGDWTEVQPSTYILWTDATPREAYASIREVMDEGDHLVVAEVREAFASSDNALVDAYLPGSRPVDRFGFGIEAEDDAQVWGGVHAAQPAAGFNGRSLH